MAALAVGVDAGTEAIKSFCHCQTSRRKVTAECEFTLYLLKCGHSAGYGLSRLEFGEGAGILESYDIDSDF